MKRTWIVKVWMDEELEGWSESDQFTAEEIENLVRVALIKMHTNFEGMNIVNCEAEEEKGDE